MPRRLALFFDGTWNKVKTHTNVERLWRLVAPFDLAGDEQVCKYVAGVGVAPGLEHWLGGAFGMGLSDNVKEGFKWLSQQWRDGDEIWLFGFSRGAYTARSLGGVIRKCGLQKPAANGEVADAAIDEAYDYYRNDVKPGVHADGSNPTAVWRAQRGARDVLIRFIGVWDTVGSLGIPGVAPWLPFSRARYAFHDTELSKIVQYAYQALAIDEHRKDFQPTKWTRPQASLRPGESPTAWKPEQIEVEQRWFAGAHADVGGGEKTDGAGHSPDTLPEIALAWMQAKAAGAGMVFRHEFLPAAGAELDVPNDSYGTFMDGLYRVFNSPFERTLGGGINETIDPSVWLKWYAQRQYRPQPVETAMQDGRIMLGSHRIVVAADGVE